MKGKRIKFQGQWLTVDKYDPEMIQEYPLEEEELVHDLSSCLPDGTIAKMTGDEILKGLIETQIEHMENCIRTTIYTPSIEVFAALAMMKEILKEYGELIQNIKIESPLLYNKD